MTSAKADVQCPLCNGWFPPNKIAGHCDTCTGEPPSTTPTPTTTEDLDRQLALQLQTELNGTVTKKPADSTPDDPDSDDADFGDEMEFDDAFDDSTSRGKGPGQASGTTMKCSLCGTSVPMEKIWIMDECCHRFCSCVRDYVAQSLSVTVSVPCPAPGSANGTKCGRPMSIRDIQSLLPKSFGPGSVSSKTASKRLMEELRHISASSPKTNGYSVGLKDDNVYCWDVRFFDFDRTEMIAQDMARLGVKEIVLEFTFQGDYPFSPPFCRVVRPRFAFHTGHVTIGGSVCMELLTRKGWAPLNTVESVIMSLRSSFLAGGARLDPSARGDYSVQEAKEAFDRLVAQHGWG